MKKCPWLNKPLFPLTFLPVRCRYGVGDNLSLGYVLHSSCHTEIPWAVVIRVIYYNLQYFPPSRIMDSATTGFLSSYSLWWNCPATERMIVMTMLFLLITVEEGHGGSVSLAPATALDVWIRRVSFGMGCGSWELRRWLFGRQVSCSGDVWNCLDLALGRVRSLELRDGTVKC